LRFQNDCLTKHIKELSAKEEICECLKYLNHSVLQITNLFKKEIDEYENFIIEEANDFHRFNKEGRKLNLLN